jgi:Kef-type K+ transport system membrane component KefB
MNAFLDELVRNLSSPLSSLILQILVILLVARLCGILGRYLGQPQVIGEILAGIFLGPSLLKIVAPEVHAFLFPQGSVQRLYFLSQVGILLFMFIVGLELDIKTLRSKARSAVVISQVSIIVPFISGIGLAFLLFAEYGPHDKGALAFALFMGIAMSITAFPVLARIIQEQGLTRTQLGTLAITCAAVDDVTAWCLLALVVGLVKSGTGEGAVWTIAFAIFYTFFMLVIVRPVLNKRFDLSAKGAQLSSGLLAFAFITLLLSAWITEMIGIHALFGAFLMGVVMPEQNEFKEKLTARIQDVTTIILLPLFFAFTGLRTQIGLLDDAQSWLICALVLSVAILGKLGGATIAARFTGHSWRTSWILGALMNTRGLMELIVLNLGYDLRILSPKIFTMMVVMAVTTTMMAGPIVRLLKPQPIG